MAWFRQAIQSSRHSPLFLQIRFTTTFFRILEERSSSSILPRMAYSTYEDDWLRHVHNGLVQSPAVGAPRRHRGCPLADPEFWRDSRSHRRLLARIRSRSLVFQGTRIALPGRRADDHIGGRQEFHANCRPELSGCRRRIFASIFHNIGSQAVHRRLVLIATQLA